MGVFFGASATKFWSAAAFRQALVLAPNEGQGFHGVPKAMRHALRDTSLQSSLGRGDPAESAGCGTGKEGKHILADTFVTPRVFNCFLPCLGPWPWLHYPKQHNISSKEV